MEDWEEAKRIADLVGQLPGSFSAAVHFLKKDAEEGLTEPSENSSFEMGRLIKSESLQNAFKEVLSKFFPGEFEQKNQKLGVREVYSTLGPESIANVLILVYLTRRIQQGCDPTEWAKLFKYLEINSEIGGLVGKAIPGIGFSVGIIVGTIRHLAAGLFLGINKKKYLSYQRAIGAKGNLDPKKEFELWGCSNVQVASLLLQNCGLPTDFTQNFSLALDPDRPIHNNTPSDEYRFWIAELWIKELFLKGRVPEMTHRGQFYPLKKDMDRLVHQITPLRKDGVLKSWLIYSKKLEPEVVENKPPTT